MQNKIAIVTGANTGLGFETTKALCQQGFTVVMACRNTAKAAAAKANIERMVPGAKADIAVIDTGKLASVTHFAQRFLANYNRLDLLINNAGIMMPPYQITDDGFESQLAVNYLGHFALTNHLLPMLTQTPASRVVSVSSLAHRWSGIQFSDIHFTRSYSRRKAYGQSKVACLLFAKELDRRLKEHCCINTLSIAAHPGLSDTNLAQHLPSYLKWLSPVMGQPAAAGALPLLYAALSPSVTGGEYIGPSGFAQWHGAAASVTSNAYSQDLQVAGKLWLVSEEMTETSFSFQC